MAAFPAFVADDNALTVYTKIQNKLRRVTPRSSIKIPRGAEGLVQISIARDNTYNVFALAKQVSYVIFVIPKNLRIVAYRGDE